MQGCFSTLFLRKVVEIRKHFDWKEWIKNFSHDRFLNAAFTTSISKEFLTYYIKLQHPNTNTLGARVCSDIALGAISLVFDPLII